MGMTWAEKITTAPEVISPETRADDHIEQLQAWFIQETEKDIQEVTLEEDRDHRRSSLLWQLYQRKVAVRGLHDETMERSILRPRAADGGTLHQ